LIGPALNAELAHEQHRTVQRVALKRRSVANSFVDEGEQANASNELCRLSLHLGRFTPWFTPRDLE